MKRYTTPIQTLKIDKTFDIPTTQFYVTYKQGNKVLTIDKADATATDTGVSFSIELTQLQTAGFMIGPVQVQVNWIDSNDKRGATNIAIFQMTDNLLRKEIAYEPIE